jgi:hypothetical protein
MSDEQYEAAIELDRIPITRHSPDDDLLSIRIYVAEPIGAGDHHFNITPAQANRLAAFIEAIR